MNLKLDIPQPLADELKSQAESSGLDISTFVIQTLKAITEEQSIIPKLANEQFQSKLQELIDAHPKNLGSVDDSRESIYLGCGE